ncbi:IclR family transcriptional regulator [Arsenicitalea aurantiaca]|uniref:IclR family transcriptional regulator n=1 Tax=Arsenicitalea aurantiaca TaxID=1783274 RepID=A0A433X5C6_9HYPH|nr:IclR family transcriptional regulator [Arsenicitalea aurantiaca]RUT29262.1 IclR family transcriptional regulator [Arsenicitalea aurantiaca]
MTRAVIEPSEARPQSAIERTLAAIEVLALADEPIKLSDLAARLGMPKSAAHRILTGLVEAGWAEQSVQSDCYGLTLHMALIGQRQLARLDIADLRQPILDDLARRTRELVRLTAVQGETLNWVGSARGRRSGLVYEPDMSERIIPFATANGKVWLASLPLEEAVRIALAAGLGTGGAGGPRQLTSLEAFTAELETTRERGYGLAREEAEAGVGAVAVAISLKGRVVGTMSVAAPIARLGADRIEDLVPQLKAAAVDMALAWTAR